MKDGWNLARIPTNPNLDNSDSVNVVMPRRLFRIARCALIASGILTFFVVAFADLLGEGGSPGIGGFQFAAGAMSLALVVVGVLDRNGAWSARVLLAGSSAAVTLLAIECAYRYYMPVEIEATYALFPQADEEYDGRHGFRHKVDRESWRTIVRNGQVCFGSVIRRSNSDGLAGKTTIAEYRQRDIKIAVFGDSFTAWNQNQVSWPDLLEAELSQRLGMSVGVLNYGRVSYGVLQMLDLAADEVAELNPDLIIIAPISLDFWRSRFWQKELVVDGHTRLMRSIRKDEFLDYRCALDAAMIEARATPEWCHRMLDGTATEADQRVLAETTERFHAIWRDSYLSRFESTSANWNRSYVLERILKGSRLRLRAVPPLWRLAESTEDFALDQDAVRSISAIHDLKMPVLLVHLPTAEEAKSHWPDLTRQNELLLQSLERLMMQDFVFLCKQHEIPPPEPMDLLPFDNHPNYDGLKWYASVIADYVAQRYDRLSRWRK